MQLSTSVFSIQRVCSRHSCQQKCGWLGLLPWNNSAKLARLHTHTHTHTHTNRLRCICVCFCLQPAIAVESKPHLSQSTTAQTFEPIAYSIAVTDTAYTAHSAVIFCPESVCVGICDGGRFVHETIAGCLPSAIRHQLPSQPLKTCFTSYHTGQERKYAAQPWQRS